jgi:hypothetical protein
MSDENFDNLIAEMEAEENGTAVTTPEPKDDEGAEEVVEKKATDTPPTEIEYAHEHIMKEEGLTKDDLPADIKKMIVTFERKMRMAKAKNASEKTFLQIQNLSTLIADKILDYIETDSDSTEKLEDGGGFDDGGIYDGGIDNSGGSDNLEDPIDEDFEDGGSVEVKEKSSIFGGILGGIFDF